MQLVLRDSLHVGARQRYVRQVRQTLRNDGQTDVRTCGRHTLTTHPQHSFALSVPAHTNIAGRTYPLTERMFIYQSILSGKIINTTLLRYSTWIYWQVNLYP